METGATPVLRVCCRCSLDFDCMDTAQERGKHSLPLFHSGAARSSLRLYGDDQKAASVLLSDKSPASTDSRSLSPRRGGTFAAALAFGSRAWLAAFSGTHQSAATDM